MASPFLARYPNARDTDDTTWSPATWYPATSRQGTWRPANRQTVNNPAGTWHGCWTQTAATTITQQVWQASMTQPVTTATASNFYAYNYSGVGWLDQTERRVSAEVRVHKDLFEDHPDPDALFGEQMDVLRKQLEEALGMRIPLEAVWEEWCSDDLMSDDVVIRAEWTPRALTVEAWDAWQELPKMRRVWDHATRSYTEIDAAEFRRREWKSNQHALIIRNRGRATQLRERIAQRRALGLLLSMLDEAQAQQWESERAFTIETADGARRYRIRHGVAGNIMLVKDGDREAPPGAWLRRFCFHAYHPDGGIPVEDHVLAQKLFIESDEESFLRLANPA